LQQGTHALVASVNNEKTLKNLGCIGEASGMTMAI
jgi:hypothetical protein